MTDNLQEKKQQAAPQKKTKDKEPTPRFTYKNGEGYSLSGSFEEIKRIFCTNESELLSLILSSGALALSNKDVEFSMNATAQAIAEYKPNNVTEARLVAQAQALYSQGMDLLHYATKQEWLPKEEFYLKNATKLLRLHNETVQTLDKLRRGGEQRVIVQHVNVEGGAQAIVNNGNMNAGGGGGKEKTDA